MDHSQFTRTQKVRPYHIIITTILYAQQRVLKSLDALAYYRLVRDGLIHRDMVRILKSTICNGTNP